MDARADLLLQRVRSAGNLWLMHANADPDCVASAFALQKAFGGVVGAPEGLSRAGARLAQRLAMEVDVFPHPENHANVVAVDTSSRAQLGRLGGRVGEPLIVDHHRYGDMLPAGSGEGRPMAWDPTRSSCAEVVLSLLDRASIEPTKETAFALLCGLVTDTARFRYATPESHRDAARLLHASGATMESVYELFERDEDEEGDGFSRRNATLLAATRAKVEAIGGHLVATSEVGSFDAAAALALVRAGADVAIVAQEKSMTARLSMRASESARGAGIHLGEVANEAARAIGWSGGGHEGAAGMNGKPPVTRAIEEVLTRIRTKWGTG